MESRHTVKNLKLNIHFARKNKLLCLIENLGDWHACVYFDSLNMLFLLQMTVMTEKNIAFCTPGRLVVAVFTFDSD